MAQPMKNPMGVEPAGLPNPDEVLNKSGVDTILKNALTLVLENRPENPIQFLAEYFKSLNEDPNMYYMMKAYKLLTLNRHCQRNYMENIYLAYRTIVNKKGSLLRGIDLFSLIEALFVNFPTEIKHLFIQSFNKSKEDIISFEEFALIIENVLLFQDYAEDVGRIFTYLDKPERGIVSKADLLAAFDLLSSKSTGMPLPPYDVIKSLINLKLEKSKPEVTYSEFLTLLFYSLKE